MIKNSIQSWDGHSSAEKEEYIKRKLRELSEQVEEIPSAIESASHLPKIEDGTWRTWNAEQGEYVDTEVEATGPQGETGPQGPIGPQGNTGASVDYPYELVNNRTTDDATKGLSAAEGKRLGDDLNQLGQEVSGIKFTEMVDSGYIVIEQGSIGGTGQNISSGTRLRIKDAIPTSIGEITVPDGFIIQAIFYYSAWTDSSTYTYSALVSAGTKTVKFNTAYNYARIILRNDNGDNIIPGDLLRSLYLVSPKVDELGGKVQTLNYDTLGFNYEGAFSIPSAGEHSSNNDRIVFSEEIYPGTFTILVEAGDTGNSGVATLYVKSSENGENMILCSVTIGQKETVETTGKISSIGIYMTASVNQSSGSMPLTIETVTSIKQRVDKADDSIDELQKEMLSVKKNELSVENKAIASGRNSILPIDLKSGITYHVTVDVSGASSRYGNIFPGWYNGNTSTIITVPESAKPTILSSVNHIEFDYTPGQDYPNGIFGLSNYSYDSSNIQYASVTIENVSLESQFEKIEEDITGILDGESGLSIFSFNPDVEVKQKFSQLVMPFSLSGVPVADSVVSFLHFSDIHAQKVNLERIVAFANKYKAYLNDVLSSGDQIAEQISNSFAFWNECGAQKVLLAIGNHETWQHGAPNDESAPASQADCYAKYFGNISQWGVTSPGANKCYYYKDYNTAGSYPLRLIVIDCMHIDTDQTTWFTNTLADARTNGYTVVIMSHYSPSVLANVQFDENSTFTCAEGPRTWTGYATVVPFELLVKDFVDAGGKFACWLCGHLHWDMFGLSQHNQPVICIECATTVRTDRYDARVVGTKTQDSFNIVTFDTYKGVLRVFRVGNNMDRYMRPKETMCYDYVNKTGIFNS